MTHCDRVLLASLQMATKRLYAVLLLCIPCHNHNKCCENIVVNKEHSFIHCGLGIHVFFLQFYVLELGLIPWQPLHSGSSHDPTCLHRALQVQGPHLPLSPKADLHLNLTSSAATQPRLRNSYINECLNIERQRSSLIFFALDVATPSYVHHLSR